jgi:hypothetical protein
MSEAEQGFRSPLFLNREEEEKKEEEQVVLITMNEEKEAKKWSLPCSAWVFFSALSFSSDDLGELDFGETFLA